MNRIKFIDRLASGRISRRQMLQSAAAFGVGLAALKRPAPAAEVLTCLEWSGYDAVDYFQPYVGKHGGPPNFSIFAGEEDALAKVRAGFAADVMHPCNYSVNRFVTAGLSVPIDTAKLSNWKDVFPSLQTAEGVVLGGQVVMAPADWGNSSIAYRSDLIGDAFKDGETWGIFYDEKYTGKVSMIDDTVAMVIGAMVNGKSYDEAHVVMGADLEAAKTFAAKTVNASRMLWTDPTEMQQALASGEVVAAYAWNDTIKNLTGQKIPVAFAKPKEGYFTWFCGLTLLNSGKADPALAYDFIDAWLSPETGKALIEGSGYGHSNMKSFEVASVDSLVAMGIKDPAEHMKSAILFKTPQNEVTNAHNKAWEEAKALKQ
ncbi:MAG: extracellular solute-binding protein [Alphaproteobacteria bacterium]|nr:extracellular solute-binding protein [Alphaproteobacteria bacterium]